ncbi:MAG: hypothetical protein U1D30_10745 [Planctomycetota bacterium]
MKRVVFVMALATSLFCSMQSRAEHEGDVLIGYGNGKVVVTNGPVIANEVGFADFPFPDSTDEPGFDTKLPSTLVNGDILSFSVLGGLFFHNGISWAPLTNGETITIDQYGSVAITADSGDQPGFAFGQVSGGIVHEHMDFTLSSDTGYAGAAIGAYGIRLSLQTSNPNFEDSDPFMIVINNGLDEVIFDAILPEFAVAVPEASSVVMTSLALLGGVVGIYRQRRRQR